MVKASQLGADPSLNWRIASSPARPDSLVALSFKPGQFGTRAKTLEPRLAVLERRGGELALVARGDVDLRSADCRNESGDSANGDDRIPELEIDPARYEIAADRGAIGVRFTCFRAFAASEGSETRLLLFEQVGITLRQVFDAAVAGFIFDRPSGKETTTVAEVSVAGEESDGHRVLVVRTTRKTDASAPGELPETARDPVESVELQRYTWRGERYVAVKAHAKSL